MADCSLSTLLDEACENGFRCLDENTFRGVLLQLLCDFQAGGGGGNTAVWGGISGTLANQADLVAAIAAAQAAATVSSRNQSGAASPSGVAVPAYVGQLYINTTAPYQVWFSVGLTNADWVQMY